MKNIDEELKQILREHLGLNDKDIEAVTPETLLMEELGADSLDVIEVCMAAEDVFDIGLNIDDHTKVPTFGALRQTVKDVIGEVN